MRVPTIRCRFGHVVACPDLRTGYVDCPSCRGFVFEREGETPVLRKIPAPSTRKPTEGIRGQTMLWQDARGTTRLNTPDVKNSTPETPPLPEVTEPDHVNLWSALLDGK